MTQQQANLIHWINVRNAARSWAEWHMAQERVDTLFMAMGHERAELAPLVDRELIFPVIRAAFELREARGDVRRNGVQKENA